MTLPLIFWESALPFLLVFTAVYALLRKTRALGKENNTGAIAVSLTMALTLVLLHAQGAYPAWFDPVEWINIAMQYFGLALALLLMTLLILGILRIEVSDRLFRKILFMVLLVDLIVPDKLVLALFFGGTLPDWFTNLLSPEIIATLVGLAVFVLLVWFVTYDAKAARERRKKLKDYWLR